MGKQLTIRDNNNEYTLEYNRKSIEIMLDKFGFVPSDDTMKMVIQLPVLFRGAFIMHHPKTRNSLIDEIYGRLKNKQNLIEKLIEMYNEPISALVDEPEPSEGNAEWEANW